MTRFRRINKHGIATIVFLVAIIAPTAFVHGVEQLDARNVYDSDGTLLGYVHEFSPSPSSSGANVNVSAARPPFVYLPGFEINIAAVLAARDSTSPGGRKKGSELFSKLRRDGIPSGDSFLNQIVDTHGYHVHVLEYADENASIKDNAILLERFLTDENSEVRARYQQDGTRAIVFGWSMGGLIARYALNDLESRGVDHYTDLYISHDAPHRGAYIPTTVEAFAGILLSALNGSDRSSSFRGFIEIIETAVDKFNTPAAREQLKIQIGSNARETASATVQRRYREIAAAPDTAASHPDYYKLRNELVLSGVYPQSLIKMAISNGSVFSEPVPLNMPRIGNRFATLTAAVPVFGNFRLTLLELKLYDDSFDTARSTCSVNFMFERNVCPSQLFPNSLLVPPHQSLSTTSGSTVNTFQLLADAFDDQETLEDELSEQGYNVSFQSRLAPGEGSHRFISVESALDLNEPLSIVGAADLNDQTLWDRVYASTEGNLPHNAVSSSVMHSLPGDLDDYRSRKVQTESLIPVLF